MSNTVTITNQKGGVGKTTTSFNVSAVMAMHFNKKVLVVDMDGQANLTTAFGFNPDDFFGKSTYEMLLNKKDPKSFIIKTGIENLDLLPSCEFTSLLNVELLSKPMRELTLDRILKKVKKDYDLILIDTPPDLGQITMNCIVASSHIAVVYQLDEFSIDSISQLYKTINVVVEDEDLNKNNTAVMGGVCNNFDIRNKKLNREARKLIDEDETFDYEFSKIRSASAIKLSEKDHIPIYKYDRYHKATNDYINFSSEILKWLEGHPA